MGRQSSNPTVVPSSIALLQERFRQLQKAKEMREEKELLRLFSNTEQVNPTTSSEPSRLFFTSELIHPTRPPVQNSLLHQPSSQNLQTDFQVSETPILGNLWSRDTVANRSNNLDESDVDTSLHL